MVSLNEYLNPSGPVPQNNALPPEPPVTTPKPSRIRLFLRLFFALLIIVVIGTAAFLVAKGARTFTVQGTAHLPLGPYENFSIEKEDTRVDVLLLGMRGVGDPDGGLLADTIILASYDTRTRKAALVSIPRDLYVELPGDGKKAKINRGGTCFRIRVNRDWSGNGFHGVYPCDRRVPFSRRFRTQRR